MNNIEAEIQNRLWERTFPYIRSALLIAGLLFPAFVVLDLILNPGAQVTTLAERLIAAAYFLSAYLLLAYTVAGRRYLAPIYVFGVLMATVISISILLKLHDGFAVGHSVFMLIAMTVMIVGPRLVVSVPLVLFALVFPNVSVLTLMGLGIETAGMPDGMFMLPLTLLYLGFAVLGVSLLVVHDRLQRRILLDNVQLEQLAGTDPLTTLENRRQLQAEFNRERARQRRHKHSIGVLELDIDHFKRVNDTHGHGVGDEVLRALAKRWRTLIREVDVLARIGGEEFVVLLPETGYDGSLELAERLRTGTASEPVSTSAGDLDITISIGIAMVAPGPTSLDSVLERADQALYRAKRNGRNRCEFVADGGDDTLVAV